MVEKAKNQLQFWHTGLLFMFASFVAGFLASLMSSEAGQYAAAVVALACLAIGVVIVVVGLYFRRN